MYRLLIVDDEPIIVDGLVQLFEENRQYEFDICKAYSAPDALELIKITKIDILLTDIRMPGMNGLQMLEQAMFYWPGCKVILLTGYSDFDYVYTAIKKPGVDYLLKTEGDEAIMGAVVKAADCLRVDAENKAMLELARKQMDMTVPLLRKNLLEGILKGESLAIPSLSEKFRELRIELDANTSVLILAGKIEYWPEETTYTQKINLLGIIHEVLLEQVSNSIVCDYIMMDSSRVVWFLQPKKEVPGFRGEGNEPDWPALKAYVKALMENVQNYCKDLHGVDVSFVIARDAVDWDMVNDEFDLLAGVIDKKTLTGQQLIIDMGKPNEFIKTESKTLSMNSTEFNGKLKLLEDCFDKGLDLQAEGVCRDIIVNLRSDMKENYLISMERYYMFLNSFISYINRENISKSFGEMFNVESLLEMELPVKWEKAEKFFTGLGRYICMYRREQSENESNTVIARVHRYISDNLSGDLSLVKLAEVVYFNPSYLSRFYKQVMGRNISDYINHAKAEAAKKLLRDGRIKINEIASKLGFEAPSCFTAFFKKMENMTPQEFRDSLVKQD